MESQNFDIRRGTAPVLRFRLIVPETVTDWTTTFAVYANSSANVAVLTKSGAPSASVPNANNLGILDVTLTAAETRSLTQQRDYHYTFARTNPGFEDLLAEGTITAKAGILT
jgi:hypothetical protein